MANRNVDENDLKKITKEEKKEIFDQVLYNLDNMLDIETNIENQFSENLQKLGNTKIDDGFYWYEKRVYFSIWSYKKTKQTNTVNDTPTNFIDGKSLYENYFIEDSIIVHTHSLIFPTVRGYLEEDLDGYFSERSEYLI